MSNNMSAAVLKITICFSSVCCIILIMTGCNKVADIKIVKNSTVLKNEIHKDSFIYELNIYNAKGKLSIYRLSSFKPLTTIDSNIFMEKSLKEEQGNINP